MGRPSNAPLRRQQIIEATVRVMARTGFDGASTMAIAKEAGLSGGLVHHHFGSKAQLLEALPEHLESLVDARYQVLAARRRGALGRLEAWVDAHLAQGDDAQPEAAAAWVWLGAQALKDEGLRARYQAVVQRRLETLSGLIEDAGADAPSRVDARALAVSTLATVEGYYQLAMSTEVVPPNSAAPALCRSLRQILGGRSRR